MRLRLPAAAGHRHFGHHPIRVDRALRLPGLAVTLGQQEVAIVALGTGAQLGKRLLEDRDDDCLLLWMDQHGVVVHHVRTHVPGQLLVGGRRRGQVVALGARRAYRDEACPQPDERPLAQAGVVRRQQRAPVEIGSLVVPAERLRGVRRCLQGPAARPVIACVRRHLLQGLQARVFLPVGNQVLAVAQPRLCRHEPTRSAHAQFLQGGPRVIGPTGKERPVHQHVQDLLRQIDAVGGFRLPGAGFPRFDGRQGGGEQFQGPLGLIHPQLAEGGAIERRRHRFGIGELPGELQIRVAGRRVAAALVVGGGIQIGGLGRDRGIGCLRSDRQREVRFVGLTQAVVHATQRQMAVGLPDAAVAVAQIEQRLLILAGVVQLRSQCQASPPVELPTRFGLHDLTVEPGGAHVLAARTVDAADTVDRLQRIGPRAEPPQIRQQPQSAIVLLDGDGGIGGVQQPGHRRLGGSRRCQDGGGSVGLHRQPQPFPRAECRFRLSQRLPRARQDLQRLGQARVIGKSVGEALQRVRAGFQLAVLDHQVGPVQGGPRCQIRVRPLTGFPQRLQSQLPLVGLQIGKRQMVVGSLGTGGVKAGVQRGGQRVHRTVGIA